MSELDAIILELNWELQRARLANADYQYPMDISSSCYVVFGTKNIAVYKWRKGRWYRKIVADWKNLSFDEFSDKYAEVEWEVYD